MYRRREREAAAPSVMAAELHARCVEYSTMIQHLYTRPDPRAMPPAGGCDSLQQQTGGLYGEAVERVACATPPNGSRAKA